MPKRLIEQFLQGQRRHAHCINGEEQEFRISVEQFGAVGDQRRQVFLQPPHFAFGPATEFGRIEQYAVITPPAPDLPCHEFLRVIDDPAHRRIGHAG